MSGSHTPDAQSSPLHDFSVNLNCDSLALPESLKATECPASFENSETFEPRVLKSEHLFQVKPGDLVGNRYKILSLIASGGMGIVYKVEQVYLGKILALKVLNASCASDVTVRRFQHEARAAFGIDHPNLISVHDFGLLEDKVPFLVMDYVNGESMSERIRSRGTLTVAEAVPIFLRICFGLGYAHGQGVIHRDIKPSNIMLVDNMSTREEGSVKIVDFGIAKFTQVEKDDIQALTRTGEVFGSPLYMSPEQCTGSPVDLRSDIYSLGCVFFEALTGTTPFVGANALTTMMQHMGEKAPTLKEASMGKDFPPLFEQIIAKMLTKNLSERYQSLAQVAGDLAVLERTLEDPHLLANTVLVEEKPKKAARDWNEFKLNRTWFCLLMLGAILLTAVVSSLITSRFTSSPDAKPLTVVVQKSAYSELNVRHVDEVKKFVKSLEAKDLKNGVSLKAILVAIKQQNTGHKLRLKFLTINDLGLKAIAQQKWVQTLDLLGSTVDNGKMIELAQLPNLSLLSIGHSNLDDVGASGVSKCQNLSAVIASWTSITDKAIPYFTAMKSLQRLEVSGAALTPLSIRFLADKQELQNLELCSVTGVRDDSFAPMVNSNLSFLNVEGVDIGDDAAVYFSQMRRLNAISIGLTRITPAGVKQLLKNESLSRINYAPTATLTEADVQQLAKTYPHCRFVNTASTGGLFR